MCRARRLDLLIAVVAVGGAAVAVWLDDTAGAPELLFFSIVLLCLMAVVRLAGRSGRPAAEEGRRARRLAATRAGEVAARAVAEERARLAADIQVVVRTAATAMGEAADEASRRWDDDPRPALHRIQEQGERAGLELRRLLGLLREVDVAEPSRAAAAAPRGIVRRDVVLAAAVTVLAVAETFAYRGEVPGGSVGPTSVLLTAWAAAAVVLRRAAPDVGALVCGAAFAVGIATEPLTSGFWLLAGPGVLTWTAIGRRGLRGVAAVGLLAAAVAAETAVHDPVNLVMSMLVLGAAAGAGAAVRIADVRAGAARDSADRRQHELDAAAEAAVRAERLTVARELHDVVSHAVGVMVMQSGAALATLDSDPARARRALEVVRRTSAETLSELDQLLRVMDCEVLGGPPVASPGHDSAELEALVERMRGAGLHVRLVVDDPPSGEAAAVAYRIVQEALTNVVRHAPGAGVQVRVASDPDGVTVDVVDDGPDPDPSRRPGYGLVGIAERVHRLGGEFSAGTAAGGGGFRVHARMPAWAASES